jgi:hypothetical protein
MQRLWISRIAFGALLSVSTSCLQYPSCLAADEKANSAPAETATVTDSATSQPLKDVATSTTITTPVAAIVTPTPTDSVTITSSKRIFHEGVVQFASPSLDQQIDDLVSQAVFVAENRRLLDSNEHKYNKYVHRMIASSKDIAELATSCRGFEQSSEAADIILDEKLKLKSKAAVALAKQRQANQLQTKVVATLMQMTMGYGLKDAAESDTTVKQGYDSLVDLVGEEKAAATQHILSDWCDRQKSFEVTELKPVAGPLQMKSETEGIMQRAIGNDTCIGEIKHSLHKYNGRSNLARATAKVVNTGLSLAAFTPTFISPAAQVAWVAYIMTQGGPEESKLVKEVYLAKRFESRWQMLNEETNLALNSYNTAVYTHNAPLVAFSEFLVSRICAPGSMKEEISQRPDTKDKVDNAVSESTDAKPATREKI